MNFLPAISIWGWVVLAMVPPLIVLLYFLKLRRVPLEVPSTYLWHRTIEDLHVNSLWQRLRKSILLFLQLLLVIFLMIALLRPGWSGTDLTDNRLIFLVDISASMSSTDEGKTRLENAKKRIGELIDQMSSTDVAMIISFSDRAQVVQSFTNSRNKLRRKLKQIKPTNRTSNLREALLAADGLANPGRSSDPNNTDDIQVAEPMPATMYVFTDGGFPSISDFSLGNLTAKYIPVGNRDPNDNVAITMFTTERNPERPDQQQAFARLENFGDEDVQLDVSLYLNGELYDSKSVEIPTAEFKEAEVDEQTVTVFIESGAASVQFNLSGGELEDVEEGELRLKIERKDSLALDNVAYAAVNVPRRARVLFVTPENEPLEVALETDEAIKIADVTKIEPDQLETKAHLNKAQSGAYDLIIYDQCAPKSMPQANTLFIGARPPRANWQFSKNDLGPVTIIDTDRSHPMMQLIETRRMFIVEGFTVKPPPGGTSLIDALFRVNDEDTVTASLFAIGPREGYEDAVLGMEILHIDEKGREVRNTDWHIHHLSFPVFVQNAVSYLGGSRGAFGAPNVQPGKAVVLRTTSPVQQITVETPKRRRSKLKIEPNGTFVQTETEEPGIYQVREGTSDKVSRRFAVNLFDARESNLHVADKINIRHTEVKGESSWQPARKELWKWILLLGLIVLIVEWYIYNRRVYL